MFLRKWVRSNSCTGKTARYTKKGSPVDTQYRDVYKEVYSVPHEPIKTLQSAVRMEPTYTGLITGWTRAPSTYLQSRSRGWAIALGFLEASSSWQWAHQGCVLWAPLKLLLGWAHTGTGAGHTLGLGLCSAGPCHGADSCAMGSTVMSPGTLMVVSLAQGHR